MSFSPVPAGSWGVNLTGEFQANHALEVDSWQIPVRDVSIAE
jgi:hypothetical protein